MLLTIHPENPEPRKIKQIVEILQAGGVIVYPTDTVYGLGCDIFNQKAYERICRIRDIKPEKANFSFICNDLSNIADYTAPFSNTAFKLMKKTLPGPFTFILRANNDVPKMFKNKKRTVGIRIPNNPIALAIVQELGRPLLSASLRSEDQIQEYHTDAYEIHEDFEYLVDVVVDAGNCGNVPSTVIDCTEETPVVVRQGAGEVWDVSL
jgi:tRNA threonylcarbamoyl adenosine modification protein (Sua5/YciO/YrdC/YwlC family)